MTTAAKIHREEKLTGRKSRSTQGAEISLGNLVATRRPAYKMAKRLMEKDLLLSDRGEDLGSGLQNPRSETEARTKNKACLTH
jgi:hypothetical protein